MCRKCRNYNNKYSCPPFSPDFGSYVKADKLLVLLMKTRLDQFSDYKPHFRLRVANAILKPRIERVMRAMEIHTGTRFLGTGACRLCKPCKKKKGQPCLHPDKMRYSLEALGIDCDNLAKDVFGISMQWYKDKTPPEHTLVMCALPLDDDADEDKINALLAEQLRLLE
jgi:predicted metal-binding protein